MDSMDSMDPTRCFRLVAPRSVASLSLASIPFRFPFDSLSILFQFPFDSL